MSKIGRGNRGNRDNRGRKPTISKAMVDSSQDMKGKNDNLKLLDMLVATCRV